MSIAENKLVGDMLLTKLNEFHSKGGGYTIEAMNYTANSGMPSVKTIVASFMESFIFKDGNGGVNPVQIILASGKYKYKLKYSKSNSNSKC